MTYYIIFSAEAKKDVERLESQIKSRLNKKLEQVANLKDIKPVIKRLINSDIGDYRIRMGDYRITFDLDENNLRIHSVCHRKDVYR